MFNIESDIPIPILRSDQSLSVASLMHGMAVGDSFVLPHARRKALSTLIWHYKRRYPNTRFTMRTLIESGVKICRVWRLEDAPSDNPIIRGAGEPLLLQLRALPVGHTAWLPDVSSDSLRPFWEATGGRDTWETGMRRLRFAGRDISCLTMRKLKEIAAPSSVG